MSHEGLDPDREELEARFGFFPPFCAPAEDNPQVLENLWQQTLATSVENPLPVRFRERLFAYLSRYCVVGLPRLRGQ